MSSCCAFVTLQVVLGLWLAVLFMSLAHVAEVYLTSAMGTLAQNLKLPPRLAGVTLLAWANGAPDISANVAAMRAGNIRMALGSAIGAGLFVTCLIGGRLAHMARSMRVKGAMVRCCHCFLTLHHGPVCHRSQLVTLSLWNQDHNTAAHKFVVNPRVEAVAIQLELRALRVITVIPYSARPHHR